MSYSQSVRSLQQPGHHTGSLLYILAYHLVKYFRNFLYWSCD